MLSQTESGMIPYTARDENIYFFLGEMLHSDNVGFFLLFLGGRIVILSPEIGVQLVKKKIS